MNRTSLLSHIHQIEGWLSDHEALFLYHAARLIETPGDIVEIGSWKGKSTVCLAKGIQESKHKGFVWAIDPHEGIIKGNKRIDEPTYESFLTNIRQNYIIQTVKPIKKTSREASKRWNIPIRLVFIDGLHDYTHAKEDYFLWSKYIVDDGIIAFHDGFCGIEGVTKAVNEVLTENHRIKDVGTVGSILYIIVGHPNTMERLLVALKYAVICLSQHISYDKHIPSWSKTIIIHKILRLLLLTRYTLAVYI